MSPAITLSTVGLLPLSSGSQSEPVMPNSAISAPRPTRNAVRSSCSTATGVAEIIDACPLKKRSRITFGTCCWPESTIARRRQKPRGAEPGPGSKGQHHPAQCRARHSVRAAVGRRDRPLRTSARGPAPHGIGAQEPRTRHSSRVRAAHRRRSAALARSAARDARFWKIEQRMPFSAATGLHPSPSPTPKRPSPSRSPTRCAAGRGGSALSDSFQ